MSERVGDRRPQGSPKQQLWRMDNPIRVVTGSELALFSLGPFGRKALAHCFPLSKRQVFSPPELTVRHYKCVQKASPTIGEVPACAASRERASEAGFSPGG